MRNWRKIVIPADTTILNSLEIIDQGALQIALVVDEYYKLMGTVTDGDIRRGILKNISLQSPVSMIMKMDPTVAHVNETKENILAKMKLKKLHHIPILDDEMRLVRIELLDELIQSNKRTNWVILMAGGLGSRLSPMTDDTPKPLLKVGTKPILETILENFIDYGFHRFYLSVNYKADMIKAYFGDGSRWGVEIKYIHEYNRLGTAGALSLLETSPEEPMIVMNGDLLTKVNFQQLLEFHDEANAKATMCVREYEYQVPYGVVQVNNHKLVEIVEKPIQQFFVNGGIYVLNPELLEFVPRDQFFDMPSLFDLVLSKNLEAAVFPIHEYWIDIGRMDDYNRANDEYKERFL